MKFDNKRFYDIAGIPVPKHLKEADEEIAFDTEKPAPADTAPANSTDAIAAILARYASEMQTLSQKYVQELIDAGVSSDEAHDSIQAPPS